MVDASFSPRRDAAAALAFFERAMAENAVTPRQVTTDKAMYYPPALRVVLPGVEHRRSKYLNNGLERDHSHLKQRRHPMRGFKPAASPDTLARGSTTGSFGPTHLRRALYLPGIVAMCANPHLRAFAERLQAKGKPARVVIVVVMRKLLLLAWILLRTGPPFAAHDRPLDHAQGPCSPGPSKATVRLDRT